MSKKVSIITDATKLDAAMVEVGKRAQSFADSVQLVAASAVFQAVAHGNTVHANALIFAVGKGARKTALAQWFLNHGPFVAETDKDKAKEAPFRFNKDKLAEILAIEGYPTERTAAAMQHAEVIHGQHWTEHKEPPLVPENWDALAAVRKLIAQGTSFEKKGVKVAHAALLASIAAILPQGKDDGIAPL